MSQTSNHQTKYSYASYVCFPSDGNRHEIVDGDHYMNPAPSTKHQTVSRLLQFQLMQQIEMQKRGFIYNAPTDVELAIHDIVQPDIVIVMSDRKRIIGTKKLKGVPNLVIEILSDSNPNHDRVLKMKAYQRVGIPEYWLVDPDEHSVEQYVLVDGLFVLRGTQEKAIAPETISEVLISLESIWEAL